MLTFTVESEYALIVSELFLCCCSGYAGDNCQYSADPCSSMPCMIGQCMSVSSTEYQCICPPG